MFNLIVGELLVINTLVLDADTAFFGIDLYSQQIFSFNRDVIFILDYFNKLAMLFFITNFSLHSFI